jgi:hypothetical protein
MKSNWIQFKAGGELGQKGSEGGIIVRDEEHLEGARITLEKDGDITPYSITLGIYGLMFHTHFCSTLEAGNHYFERCKLKIEEILSLYGEDDERCQAAMEELINIE